MLKDLIGFHLSTAWLQKSKDFLFMSMLEKILPVKWTLLVWVSEQRFYETVEIGTVGAVGEHVIRLLFGPFVYLIEILQVESRA